jgi:hypothetical protein
MDRRLDLRVDRGGTLVQALPTTRDVEALNQRGLQGEPLGPAEGFLIGNPMR